MNWTASITIFDESPEMFLLLSVAAHDIDNLEPMLWYFSRQKMSTYSWSHDQEF